jgi:hypothetical protein
MVIWFKLSLTSRTLYLKVTDEGKQDRIRCIQELLQIPLPIGWALFSQGKTNTVFMNSEISSPQTSQLRKFVFVYNVT